MGHDGRDGRPGQKSLGPVRSRTFQASTKAPEASAFGVFFVRVSNSRTSNFDPHLRPLNPFKSSPGGGAVLAGTGRRMPEPTSLETGLWVAPGAPARRWSILPPPYCSLRPRKKFHNRPRDDISAGNLQRYEIEWSWDRRQARPRNRPCNQSRKPDEKIPGGRSPRGFSLGGRDR